MLHFNVPAVRVGGAGGGVGGGEEGASTSTFLEEKCF